MATPHACYHRHTRAASHTPLSLAHPSAPQDVAEARGAAEALATTAELMLDEAPAPDALSSEAAPLAAELAAALAAVASAAAAAEGAAEDGAE